MLYKRNEWTDQQKTKEKNMEITNLVEYHGLPFGKADQRALDCELSNFQGDPGECRWCGANLPRTKTGKINNNRRWCGQSCANAFRQQHSWNEAKKIVKSRDNRSCQACGIREKKHGQGKKQITSVEIQVHHIWPRNGNNCSTSCLNHHDNLVSVCHDCHLTATQYQQWARKYGYSDVVGLEDLKKMLFN